MKVRYWLFGLILLPMLLPAVTVASADWTAESNQAQAYFGTVSSAGDVNGDGYSDVIIGARGYDNGETDEGSAYMYYGGASGLSPAPNWMVESNQENAAFGVSVSTAGDVNGDGYADVIVGANLYDNGETDEGRAYAFYGSASGLSSTPDWIAEGNLAGIHFGISVSTAGDVNGDGYDDVIVGADRYDNIRGRAYVFHGSASGLSATADWIVSSDQVDSYFGMCVSTAGDVNGDGYSDVIIGAPFFYSGSILGGQAYAYYGSASGLSSTPDWIVELDDDWARFGLSVSTAGDVNGDDYDDVLVGAPYYPWSANEPGFAFLYHGSASGLSATANWTAEGDHVDESFGESVSAAGDINGDGYADVIIGADKYTHPTYREGGAFVYYGSASGLAATPVWFVESDQYEAILGGSVSTADVNDDGYSDIIIGAYYYANPEFQEGAAFAFYGPLEIENQPPVAVIDEICPNPVYMPDPVAFYGHGTDDDGTIEAYHWASSIDGLLSEYKDFAISSDELSGGVHTIYYEVQDNDGAWSEPALQTLTVYPDIQTGLIAYWSFDDGTAKDECGNHDGELHGPAAPEICIWGNGLRFDGHHNYIDTNEDPVITDGPLTICVWIKPRSIRSPTDHWIIENGLFNLAITSHLVDGRMSNKWLFSIGPWDYPTANPAQTEALETHWTFLCGTWDANSDEVKLYVNGAYAASGYALGGFAREVIIGGCHQILIEDKFEGLIDEVRIYDRVLDDHEIQFLYGYPDGNPAPTAVIDSILPCAANIDGQIFFYGSGEDPNGTIAAYHWDFGDGNWWWSVSGENIHHSYSSPGTYRATLKVQDDGGKWSPPSYEDLFIVDGWAYTPPYPHDPDTHEHEMPPVTTKAVARGNRTSGYAGSAVAAWIGWAEATAGYYVMFPIVESEEPTIVQVDAELISYGGKFTFMLGVAGTEAVVYHWILKGLDWELIEKDSRSVAIDPYIDMDWLFGQIFFFMGFFIPGWQGTMFSAITTAATFGDPVEVERALKAGEYETHHITQRFKVDPGIHRLGMYVRADAVGAIMGEGHAARFGKIRYITIQKVESGFEGELVITGFCPINIIVTDPEGRTISKDNIEVPSATYIETDLDLDGDRDDQVYIPDALDGQYSITVIPDSTADPSDTISILISFEGEDYVLARDVAIADIPDEPYVFFIGTPSINATIDIDPDVLNLQSQGKWVTCYIEFPDGYDVNDIEVASVFLNRTIPAESHPIAIGDYDEDSIPDLMVKFDRSRVQNILEPGDSVEILIVGNVLEEMFGGTDTIKVFNPDFKPITLVQRCGPMGDTGPIPLIFFMSQNNPNPFTARTNIQFGLPNAAHVQMSIYDAAGQLVKTLINGENNAGYYTTYWDGTDQLSRKVSAGVYFYQLIAGDFIDVKKMVLLR